MIGGQTSDVLVADCPLIWVLISLCLLILGHLIKYVTALRCPIQLADRLIEIRSRLRKLYSSISMKEVSFIITYPSFSFGTVAVLTLFVSLRLLLPNSLLLHYFRGVSWPHFRCPHCTPKSSLVSFWWIFSSSILALISALADGGRRVR